MANKDIHLDRYIWPQEEGVINYCTRVAHAIDDGHLRGEV